jgi:hypothetical protein
MQMEQVFYGNQEGSFGIATREEVDLLNKALSPGYGYSGAPGSFAGMAPLMVESLEASLKSTTWQMKNLVLWPSIPVDKAFNTVEEYARVTSYGGNGSPYFMDGGSPREEDANYNRETQNIRFFGTRRRVSHAAMIVKTAFGDAVAREINNGNMWLLQNIERELYLGNSAFSNAGAFDGNPGAIPSSTLAINGLDQQIRQGDTDSKVQAVAFDGYGGALSVIRSQADAIMNEEDAEEGAVSILNNFGVPVAMHMDPKTLSDFSRTFYPKERVNQLGVADGRAGFVLKSFVSSAGEFALVPNVFLRPKSEPKGAADNTNVPAAPAAPTGAVAGVSSTLGAGTYSYKVAAVNEHGESLPSAALSQAASAGDKVTLTITNVSGARHYAVYRSEAGGTSVKFIGYVAQAAGATTSFVDLNNKLPGRAEAFLLYLDPEALTFKQLAPLSKINLATVSASFEWLQVLYGTLIVFTPRKHFIYENIGKN